MKRLEKAIFVQAEQVDFETFLSYGQRYIFANNFPPGIKGTNNVFRPAFDFKRNNMIVGNNDWPRI
jgi:hypothetical protein